MITIRDYQRKTIDELKDKSPNLQNITKADDMTEVLLLCFVVIT